MYYKEVLNVEELIKIFYFVLESIEITISKRAAKLLSRPVDKAFDNFEVKYIEKNKEKYNKIKKYVLDSLGGYENIVFVEKFGNGYNFIFFDLNKVNYYHMKNFNCRVFISKKRDSMILLPKYGIIGIDISYLLEQSVD